MLQSLGCAYLASVACEATGSGQDASPDPVLDTKYVMSVTSKQQHALDGNILAPASNFRPATDCCIEYAMYTHNCCIQAYRNTFFEGLV